MTRLIRCLSLLGSLPEQPPPARLGGVQQPQCPAGGASPPCDLGAVLPRFPGSNTRRAAGQPTQGSLRTWKKSRHEPDGQHAPRMPVQNAGPFGRDRPRGAEGTGSRSWLTGPCRAVPCRAGLCAKPQRLLLSGCGTGLFALFLTLLPEVSAQAGSCL